MGIFARCIREKKTDWFSLDVQQWRLFWEQKRFVNSMNKTHLQLFPPKTSSLPPSHSSLLHPLPIIPSKTVYRILSVSFIVWLYGLHQQSNDAAHHVLQETLAFHSDPGQTYPRRRLLRRSVPQFCFCFPTKKELWGVQNRCDIRFYWLVNRDARAWFQPLHATSCQKSWRILVSVKEHHPNLSFWWSFTKKPQSVWRDELCWLWVIQFCYQSPKKGIQFEVHWIIQNFGNKCMTSFWVNHTEQYFGKPGWIRRTNL